MTQFAWVVRPYPHGRYRLQEFLDRGVVALGYPGTGDPSGLASRDEAKAALARAYGYAPRALGQRAGMLYNLVRGMRRGEYVLVPDGRVVFVGRLASDEYRYAPELDNDAEGYPHQRDVEWLYEKGAIPRGAVTGRLFDALKGRSTLFTTTDEDVERIVREDARLFVEGANVDLKREYLRRLQMGVLRGVNSHTFENAVRTLLERYFPGIRRLGTSNSAAGDTDLLAELPGRVTVRVQVKHFYPEHGAIQPWVVEQLAGSMDTGQNGVVVTSGTVSAEAERAAADELPERAIAFIYGEQFVELLFERIDEMTREEPADFGLASRLGFMSGGKLS